MYFRQTNSDLGVKECILGKQTGRFETIKNQRDKQIALFISLIVNLLSRNEGINTPPR
jgi:hypothetical protein